MGADYETAVFALYRYPPSLAAAIVAIVLFILTTALHTYQVIRTRTTFFIPLVIGGYFEWIGYIGRAINSQQTPNWTLGPYILQSILLLVAPALFAATIYMTLGRIVKICNAEKHLIVRPDWLTKIFVIGDVFSFLVQSSGAGYMAQGNPDALSTGEKIVLGGLFLQIFFFGLFVAVSIRFHSLFSRDHHSLTRCSGIPWRKHMLSLYGASFLILIRSIYRAIEYLQGNSGYIMDHEIFLYVFDGILMFIVLLLFNIVHGGELKRVLEKQSAIDEESFTKAEFRGSRATRHALSE